MAGIQPTNAATTVHNNFVVLNTRTHALENITAALNARIEEQAQEMRLFKAEMQAALIRLTTVESALELAIYKRRVRATESDNEANAVGLRAALGL